MCFVFIINNLQLFISLLSLFATVLLLGFCCKHKMFLLVLLSGDCIEEVHSVPGTLKSLPVASPWVATHIG